MFEKMTGISEEYITEAALVPAVGASPARKPENRFAALSRALNSGWGVACICFIVAIAAVVGILHWGLPGASVNPFPPAVDPNAPRYVYSLGSLHSFSHGESVDRPVERGEDIYLTVSVQNNGPAFQIRDSEWAQLSAVCVLQGDDSVTLEWRYSPRDGGNQPYWVQTGATETLGFVLTIPENATPGVYDLVLSYDGVKQVFGGALTVGETAETYPPVEEGHAFSFGYELAGDALTGATYLMDTWVINEGEAFTYEGSSMGFAPTASLIHMETQYRIDGSFGMDDDQGIFTVNPGDIGRVTQEFFIPTFAPTGAYALQLSYGGVSKSFPGVVIVAEPTDVDLDYPLPEDGHPFSFGYEPFGGFAIPGDWLTVKAWVINEGEPFSFFGDPNSFEPVATLHHVDSGYVIQGHSAPTGIPPKPCNVLTGQKGESAYTFPIPANAPTGVYGLKLSYGGAQETFDNVLTVAVPTVIDPAVLYNLTMPIGSDWLYEPLQEAYPAGEEVTVRIKFATDVGTLFFLNGEVIDALTGDDQLGYWEYSFIMPQKDSQILFQTYDGTAPYYKMLEACICSNPYGFREDLFYYYGEFGDGVMVALQLGYGDAIWSTTVGDYTFVTPNTHDMMVFHNGTLYELQEAYDMGLLTDGDLDAMMATHKEWFPDD